MSVETINSEAFLQHKAFDEQIQRRQKIISLAGNFDCVTIIPPEISDPVPIILVQGWGETIKTHSKSLRAIYESHRKAICMDFPRRGGTKFATSFPEVEFRKAEAINSVVSRQRPRPIVDVIAHSEGALSTIIYAASHPGNVRNVVFVDPAGLSGKDSTPKLAVRFAHMLAKDGVRLIKGEGPRGEMLKAANEANKYFLGNPIRGLKEARAIATADIYKELEDLIAKGTSVSVIHGVNDTLFSMKKILDTSREKGGISTIGFYSVKGDHREISVHPEKYTALAVNALENLSKRQTP